MITVRVFCTNLESECFSLKHNRSIPEMELVSRFVWHLKEQFPHNEFQVIKIGKKRYNVVPLVTSA